MADNTLALWLLGIIFLAFACLPFVGLILEEKRLLELAKKKKALSLKAAKEQSQAIDTVAS